MEGVNGLMSEVLQSRADIGMTEEEYWEQINDLANASIGADEYSLQTLRSYYETHDENVLTLAAEKLILRGFGLLKY